jgi:hypothetical protein
MLTARRRARSPHNTPRQMYGEKTEEAEKLRLDLEDVKEMYKMQIVQLTGDSGTGGTGAPAQA